MDLCDYDKKLQSLLDDVVVYQKLEKDPAPALERRMNSKLLSLRKQGQLPENVYHQLWSTGCQTPLIYVLPKVHKKDVPFAQLCLLFSLPLTTFLNISPVCCHHLLGTHTQQSGTQGTLWSSFLPRPSQKVNSWCPLMLSPSSPIYPSVWQLKWHVGDWKRMSVYQSVQHCLLRGSLCYYNSV